MKTLKTILITLTLVASATTSAMVFDEPKEVNNTISATSCGWSAQALQKYNALKKQGTSEYQYFARYVEAQVQVCKGSVLSVAQIMRLHAANDVATR